MQENDSVKGINGCVDLFEDVVIREEEEEDGKRTFFDLSL